MPNKMMAVGIVRNDAEPVPVIVLIIITTLHTDGRRRHPRVRPRRHYRPRPAAPAIQPQPDIARHIARRSRRTAVAGAIFHPGRRNERITPPPRAVIMPGNIPRGHTMVGRMADYGIGSRHPQRFQNPPPQRLPVTPAVSVLQQPAQQLVARVGIVKSRPRLPGRLRTPQRVALVTPRRRKVRPRRQAGSMAQHVPQRNRAIPRRHREPGQMRTQRRVQIQPPRLHQLHQRQRRHRLANAANLKCRIRQHRPAGFPVRIAQPRRVQRAPPVGNANRQPRRRRPIQPALQILPQKLELRPVRHSCPRNCP